MNEFFAYEKLGRMIRYRDELISAGTFELYRNGTYQIPSEQSIIWNVNKDKIERGNNIWQEIFTGRWFLVQL